MPDAKPLYQTSAYLDDTPIDTDYTDIKLLFADMRKHAKQHPDWAYLCADDPGHHHDPVRVPRLGWTGFPKDDPNDGESKQWTITLTTVKNTRFGLGEANTALALGMETALGRQKLLEHIIGRPGHPNIGQDSPAEAALLAAQEATLKAVAAWEEVERLEQQLGHSQTGLERDMAQRGVASAGLIIQVLKSLVNP